MDGLARDPDRLTTPHNTDTGETILHLLAKVYRKWHSMLIIILWIKCSL